jgi:hypothetical protein
MHLDVETFCLKDRQAIYRRPIGEGAQFVPVYLMSSCAVPSQEACSSQPCPD